MAGDGSIIIETGLDTSGLEKGLDSLEELIEKGLDGAKTAFSKAFEEMGSAIDKKSFSEGIGGIISSAADTVRNRAAELGSAVRTSAEDAAEELGGAAGDFRSGGQALMSAAAEGLSSGAGSLGSAASGAASGAAAGIGGRTGEFRAGGAGLINAAKDGLASGAEALGSTAQSAALGAADRMKVNDSFSSVGQNLIAALRGGIAAGAAALYAKAAEIAARVVATIKGAFKIHSPSAVFRDEIGKMLMLGLRDGILNNRDAVLEATKDLAEDMLESERRYLEEKSRIDREQDEEDEARRVREYEKKLSLAEDAQARDELIEEERLRLKKRADSLYLEQLEASAEKEREIVDALKDDITTAYKEIADYAEETLEPVAEKRERLEKRLKDYAAGESGVRRIQVMNASGKVESTFYTLADQREAIETLSRYANGIKAATARIKTEFDAETAKSFTSALTDMDVEEGALFAEALAAASAEDFRRYVEDWGLKNTLAEEISRQIYTEEFTGAVDQATQYMRSELEKLGLEVPDGFFASGSLSAKEFGRGFSEGLNAVLEDARKLVEGFAGLSGPAAAAGVSSVVNNNNYYSTYSITGTRSTAAESIFALEAAAAMNRYRGLN